MVEGISNRFIESVLKPTCENFRGVFSADTIPTELLNSNNFSIVCNMSGVNERGSHFVTILVKPDQVFYIDSLGLPPIIPEMYNFLQRLRKPMVFNSKQVQDFSSKFCGFFCILFVLNFNFPSTPLSFQSNDLMLNDVVCVEKIQEILNKFVY